MTLVSNFIGCVGLGLLAAAFLRVPARTPMQFDLGFLAACTGGGLIALAAVVGRSS